MATGGEVRGQITDVVGSDELSERGAIVKAEHIMDINVSTETDSDTGDVFGSTFLSDSIVVITDFYNMSIKVVDFNKNEVIGKKVLIGCPYGICTIKPDQVAVTMPPSGRIVIVTCNVDGDITVDRIFHDFDFISCHGIDYKNDMLAVSTCSIGLPKILLLSLQGEKLREIMTNHLEQNLFNRPLDLTFDHDGKTLYVVNAGSRNVVRVNLDGTIVASYTGDELRCPAGVVLDSDGNVYVCCIITHDVHQLTPDCRKLRVLLKKDDGVTSPYSLSYRKTDDTFWMGTRDDNRLRVFKAIRDSP